MINDIVPMNEQGTYSVTHLTNKSGGSTSPETYKQKRPWNISTIFFLQKFSFYENP